MAASSKGPAKANGTGGQRTARKADKRAPRPRITMPSSGHVRVCNAACNYYHMSHHPIECL